MAIAVATSLPCRSTNSHDVVSLSSVTACRTHACLTLAHTATRTTEEASKAVDKVAKDAMHDIDGVAAKQRQERLSDGW